VPKRPSAVSKASIDAVPHDPRESATPPYDKAQLTSALELLRRRISDLREPDSSVEALLQLVELVKRQTMALHAHTRVLQAASASDTPRTVRLEQEEPAPARDTSASTHLLFLPGPEAYGLAERDGGPPPVGTILAIGGRQFEITKVARSPLPGDPRSCVYGIEQVMADERDV
jgi:hypothetical protein